MLSSKIKIILSLLITLLLAILVWLVGPILFIGKYQPLSNEWARLGLIACLFISWGLINFNSNQKNTANKSEEKAPEKSTIQKKNKNKKLINEYEKSIILLNQLISSSHNNLYAIPWYIVLNDQKSNGKSLFNNTDINIIKNHQVDSLNTENLSFILSENSLYINIENNFLAESNTEQWHSLLAAIKKKRPKKGINGIILNFSLETVKNQAELSYREISSQFRRKANDINTLLSLQLPLYLIINQIHHLIGGSQFLDKLNNTEKNAALGMTLSENSLTINEIHQEIEEKHIELVERMANRINHALINIITDDERVKISQFVSQFHHLSSNILSIMDSLLIDSQFSEKINIRGIYFCGVTEKNSEAVWVKPAIQQLYNTSINNHSVADEKTYFLKDLLLNNIHKESHLVNYSKAKLKKYDMAKYALLSLIGLSFSASIYALINSKNNNKSYIEEANNYVTNVNELSQTGLENLQYQWQDLEQTLSYIKSYPTAYDSTIEKPPLSMGVGLYQGKKIGSLIKQNYISGVENYLFEDVDQLLLNELKSASSDDHLYQSLKFYLMFHHPEHRNNEELNKWLSVLLHHRIHSNEKATIIKNLLLHINEGLNNNFNLPVYDKETVSLKQELLSQTPVHIRIYRLLKSNYQEKSQLISLKSLAGNKSSFLFYYKDGKNIDQGFSDFYSYNSYHNYFKVNLLKSIKNFNQEKWVYGSSLDEDFSNEEKSLIYAQIDDLYLDEYIDNWTSLLSNIALFPIFDLDKGPKISRIISKQSSPFNTLLGNVKKHLSLGSLPMDGDNSASVKALVEDKINTISNDKLADLVKNNLNKKSKNMPGSVINEHFKTTLDYISDQSLREELIETFAEINNEYDRIALSEQQSVQTMLTTFNSGKMEQLQGQLKEQVSQMPNYLKIWFTGFKSQKTVTGSLSNSLVNDIWKSEIYSFYIQAIANRYPVNPQSNVPIKMNDFNQFFAPEGILHSFFKTYIEPYVDTSQSKWHWKKYIGLSDKSLRVFQQAAKIRKTYFNNQPSADIKFEIKPYALDSNASMMQLSIGSKQLIYKHGKITPTQFNWPSTPNSTILTLILFDRTTPISKQFTSPWGLFEFLDTYTQSKQVMANQNILYNLVIDGYKIQLEWIPSSVFNPFMNDVLENFNLTKQL